MLIDQCGEEAGITTCGEGMSADPVVYCLEHLTDYSQFERLCSDVMNQSGYRDIEPLGGTNDRGRDALHISRVNSDDVTIFAYSVRGDWKNKLLNEDCKRIQDEKHELQTLVFVTTASVTSTQRDSVKEEVMKRFGWNLELFDIERLRIRLVNDLRYLVAQHPAIFCEPFFPKRGGLSVAESLDTIVVDHAPPDHALATWLARRLQLLGYRTWCYGTAPLAGETADETVRTLIERRALRYLPILSGNSIANADLLARCSAALVHGDRTVPCRADNYDDSTLPTKLSQLSPARFSDGWATGLNSLVATLDALKPLMTIAQGTAVALRSYVPEPVTKASPDPIYANVFRVTCPTQIQACDLSRELTKEEEMELRKSWSFVVAHSTLLLSFEKPPASVPRADDERPPRYSWMRCREKFGKRSVNVVKELVRRSMEVACWRAGLQWCDSRHVFYFQKGDKPLRNVSFTHVDGRKTRVAVTGFQSYGSGDHAKPFHYQLSPGFRVGFDGNGACWLTLRVYVRVTDEEGAPYEGKAIGRRRKKVAKSWWNKEWFARTIGVMQALSAEKSTIVVGSGKSRLTVSCTPLRWECPVAIDYHAVERVGDFQDEMAQLRYIEDEDEDETENDADE
ncbi:TIR domain-containing protein [Aeoliella sp.]|uniref:TIR domain-containing protein n=1 Tax=Aeoliella sp. TaxID=2795800 RepID=UPI003CCC0778